MYPTSNWSVPTGINYQYKTIVDVHVFSMIQTYSTFDIEDSFCEELQKPLITLKGLMPIVHNSAKYNIPTKIYLDVDYPQSAPIVYVTATQDMVVTPNHENVAYNGKCFHPYLSDWKFNASNLVFAMRNLSLVFGEKPPLYSVKPKASTALNEKIEEKIMNYIGVVENKLNEATNKRLSMISKGNQLRSIISDCNKKSELLDGTMRNWSTKLQMTKDFLENFQNQNVEALGDVESQMRMQDHFSEEAMICFAEKDALEDATSCLDEALKKKLISIENYTASVRELSRELFKKRYLLKKIEKEKMEFLKKVEELKQKAGS